jgi:hypothetical protein
MTLEQNPGQTDRRSRGDTLLLLGMAAIVALVFGRPQ